jgi:hypothetical protein
MDPELVVALRAHPQVVRSVGLYKVMGEAVQAVVGGAYHQFVSFQFPRSPSISEHSSHF